MTLRVGKIDVLKPAFKKYVKESLLPGMASLQSSKRRQVCEQQSAAFLPDTAGRAGMLRGK